MHGIIDLSTCLTVKSAEEKVGKRHAFEVTTADETFYMFADSEKIKDDWIGKLFCCCCPPRNPYTHIYIYTMI